MIRTINRIRRALYRAGVLRSRRVPAPVISIGNITMGGAGKTPAVIAIANALAEKGLRVGVLTRGYGRRGKGGVVETLDPDRYGDEPVLIKRRAKQATVIVGVNRYANALQHSCDVYLLDDGFQHLEIARDLDIVIDTPSQWQRESRNALAHADIVIDRRLRTHVPEELRGKRVFAFAGLANNEQFFDALRKEGLTLVGTKSFPDHHHYTASDIAAIKAVDADVRVTTEKDAVKLRDLPVVSIPVDFIIPDEAMERIMALVTK